MATNIVQSITNKCEKFSIKLYKKTAGEEAGSFTISPFGVYLLSAIVSYGASQKTQQQLRDALDLSDDEAANFQCFQDLVESLNQVKDLKHANVNKIIISKCIEVEPGFKDTVEKYFHSRYSPEDYGKADKIIEWINDWCRAKSSIIFTKDDFQNLSSILLFNYAYFKGEWETQFLHQFTGPKTFYIDEQNKKEINMMTIRRGFFRYGDIADVDAKCVELPYKSSYGHFKMVFLVPNQITGLPKIEENLEKISADLVDSFPKFYVNLVMPRFKIKSIIDMKKYLEKIGVTKIFEEYAEFDNMTKEPVKVQKFIQKAVIVVDEGGPKHDVEFKDFMKKLEHVKEVDLTIDRPFLAILMYKDLPLFYTRFTGVF